MILPVPQAEPFDHLEAPLKVHKTVWPVISYLRNFCVLPVHVVVSKTVSLLNKKKNLFIGVLGLFCMEYVFVYR